MIRLSASAALVLLFVATVACSTGQHPREQGVAPGIVPELSADSSAETLEAAMPPVPQSAGPIEASPTDGTSERPPHPATPAPLQEPQPTPETLASTSYRWLPGHWLWVGNQYEWQSGLWIHDLPGYELVPPDWSWNGYEWVFHDAGWAVPGTSRVVYRPTVVSREAPAEVAVDGVEVDVYAGVSSYAVYSWPGYWIAPPIVYPPWHPYYHYYWHHKHPPHARPPMYRDARYYYARQHEHDRQASSDRRRQTWARANDPPGTGPASRPAFPSTKPLEAEALRKLGQLDPAALQASPEQRAYGQQVESLGSGERASAQAPVGVQSRRSPTRGARPSAPETRPSLPAQRAGSYGAVPAPYGTTRQVPSANRPGTTSARPSPSKPVLRGTPSTPSATATTTNRPPPSTSRPRPTPSTRPPARSLPIQRISSPPNVP